LAVAVRSGKPVLLTHASQRRIHPPCIPNPRHQAAFRRALGARNQTRRLPAGATAAREQAFGEALDPDKLERLGRYEVHLDRKLERMLTRLLRLKDLRQGAVAG
jgi:hypothetical protein